MAEYIRVQGDKENICNCIDFYQGLTKVGLMGVKELRKSYLDMYLDDYIQRCKDTLQKRKNKIEVDKAVSEESNKNMDIFRSMVNTPEEGISSHTIENKEEIESVPHEVILNPMEDKTNIDYVKNGVFLEDLVLPDKELEEVLPDKEVEEVSTEEIEWVSHGVYVEDLKSGVAEEDAQEEEVLEDSDEVEDSTSYDFEDSDDSDEVEDSTSYDFEEEDDDSDEVEDNDNTTPYDSEDDDSDEEFISFKDSFGSVPDDDDDDDFVFMDYQNSDDTRVKNANEEQKTSRVEIPRVKDRVIDNTEEKGFAESNVVENKPKVYDYKNVRDFVKKNPGCSYSDVKECFSMKEIQKALLTTKIVEKKNKLYVV